MWIGECGGGLEGVGSREFAMGSGRYYVCLSRAVPVVEAHWRQRTWYGVMVVVPEAMEEARLEDARFSSHGSN